MPNLGFCLEIPDPVAKFSSGSQKNLGPTILKRICLYLGLNFTEIPRPSDTVAKIVVSEKNKNINQKTIEK